MKAELMAETLDIWINARGYAYSDQQSHSLCLPSLFPTIPPSLSFSIPPFSNPHSFSFSLHFSSLSPSCLFLFLHLVFCMTYFFSNFLI